MTISIANEWIRINLSVDLKIWTRRKNSSIRLEHTGSCGKLQLTSCVCLKAIPFCIFSLHFVFVRSIDRSSSPVACQRCFSEMCVFERRCHSDDCHEHEAIRNTLHRLNRGVNVAKNNTNRHTHRYICFAF